MRAKVGLNVLFLAIFPLLVQAAKAPDFTVTDFNGKVHNLYADYLNKDKVMVIKFFFVGCPPCATIAPYVQQAYVRWGSGNGRVQFMEITTQNGDNDILVKAYHNTKGFTFPGISKDGGAAAARSPYTSGTFGPFYGTPTFVVINPKGDVNYNVPMTTTDQSQLDTAIAQALRVTNGGGGGGTCANAFTVKTITQIQPETYYVVDLLNGNPANEIKTGKYNCEFNLASNIDGYYVIPQMNATADPVAGVTTADIVYIQRSILGLQTLNNLQKAVADVNNSGSVSAADISEIRKLVLGVTAKFNKLTKSYVVVHNPKSTNINDLTDRVLVKDLVGQYKTNEFGVGKYGDVTGANLFADDETIERSSNVVKFYVEKNKLADGTYEHRFYTDEDYDLTAFQFEVKGKSNNFIGISGSSKFDASRGFDYNLNLAPDVLRMLGSSSSNNDIHFAAGETWFTIYTRNTDRLSPSHFKNFIHEFVFDKLKKVIGNVEVEYLLNSLVGESLTLSHESLHDIVINSNENIRSIQIINANGVPVMNQNYSADTRQVKFDNTNLQMGLYFAQVHLQNGKVEARKFIRL